MKSALGANSALGSNGLGVWGMGVGEFVDPACCRGMLAVAGGRMLVRRGPPALTA